MHHNINFSSCRAMHDRVSFFLSLILILLVTSLSASTATNVAEDTEPPNAFCNPLLEIELDEFGTAFIDPIMVDQGSFDPDGFIESYTLSEDFFDCFSETEGMLTLFVTDNDGNMAQCESMYILQDMHAPQITCPDNITESNDPGLCLNSNISMGLPEVVDNCFDFFTYNDAPSTFPVGSTNVKWTAEDFFGNTASCSQTIKIYDQDFPNAVCQDISVELDAEGLAVITPNHIDNGSDDNCGVSSYALSQSTFNESNIGDNTISMTIKDVNGLGGECTSTVTVLAYSGGPIASCQDLTLNLDSQGSSFLSAEEVDAGSTGNNITLNLSNNIFNCSNISSNTVTLTVIDEDGFSDECISQITIMDNLNPTINCPADTVLSTDQGMCEANASFLGDPAVEDNCDISSVMHDAPGLLPIGISEVTWVVTDPSGNSNSCVQTITVEDNSIPEILCPEDINTSTETGLCSVSGLDLGTPMANAICSGIASISNNELSTYSIGITEVTWIAEGNNGNQASCIQTVNVVDLQNPTISCPSDLAVTSDPETCSYDGSIGFAQAEDNCSFAMASDAPVEFPMGHTAVTWTAIDDSGNLASCTQNVTVTDESTPFIICPSDTTAQTDPDLCSTSNVELGNPEFSENCNGPVTITNDAPSTFPEGSTFVTWTLTDGIGNEQICTQLVTVLDNEAPTIVCPPDFTGQVDSSSCNASGVNIGQPTVSDNCSITTPFSDAPSLYEIGTTEVLWSVMDDFGNESSCIQLVTIDDIDAAITCNDYAVNIFCLDSVVIQPDQIAVVTENCSDSNLEIDMDTFDHSHIGENIVTASITGTNISCTSVVTIIDEGVPPAIVCNDLNVELDESGSVEIAAEEVYEGSEGCFGAVEFMSPDMFAFSCNDTGINTIQLTVTDDSGNTASCTSTISVVDAMNPTIVCGSDVLMENDINECSASNVQLTEPIIEDNCGISSVDNNAPNIFPVGNTIVTWTATDVSGNSTSCDNVVTIIDIEEPAISCPSDITVMATPGQTSTEVSISGIIASDNCGIETLINDYNNLENPSDNYPVGVTNVNCIAIDINGNPAECTFTVTVLEYDESEIDIICAEDITIDNIFRECYASVSVPSPTTLGENITLTNNYTNTEDASAEYPVGVSVIVWTATNQSGDSASCIQAITVVDSELPEIACPADITVDANTGATSAEVSVPNPIFSDNCGIEFITNDFTNSDNASGNYPVGETLVTFTVTDVSGNQASCSVAVTVMGDVEDELEITCPQDLVLDNEIGECSALVTVLMPTVTGENVTLLNSYTGNGDATGTYPVGSTEILWSAFNTTGDSVSCIMNITVLDVENPTIEGVPTDILIGCNDPLPEIPEVAASDNCPDVTIEYSSTGEQPGVIYRTWTATDAAGNMSTSFYRISTASEEDIVFNGLPTDASVSIECDDEVPNAPVVTATADCGATDVTVTFDESDNGTCPRFIARTWTATHMGQTTTFVQSIVVNDVTAPVLTGVPSDVVINCGDEIPEVPSIIAEDNCDMNVEVVYAENGFYPGDIVRSWTAIDDCGNATTVSYTISVNDSEGIVFIGLPTQDSVFFDCDGNVPLTPSVSATAQCGSIDVPVMFDEIETGICPRTIIRTWTASYAEQSESFTQTLMTNEDLEAPIIEGVPEDVLVSCGEDVPPVPNVIVFDNCDPSVEITYVEIGSQPEDVVRTWTATDDCGNTTTVSYTISFDDGIIFVPIEFSNGVLSTSIIAEDYQWYICDGDAISGETAQTFDPVESGDYSVRVNSASCPSDSDCLDVVIGGLDNLSLTENIAIYPNPSSGLFSVEITSATQGDVQLSVLNELGQVILMQNAQTNQLNQIDLSDANTGIYLLQVITSTTIETKVIVKK